MNVKSFIKMTVFLFLNLLSALTAAFAAKPNIIPSIKEWIDQEGFYILSKESQIIVDQNGPSGLTEIANTFKNDIKSLKMIDIEVTRGESFQKGDIFLTLISSDSIVGEEGYSMQISNSIKICAAREPGVFYATRSLLQMLKKSDTIAAGSMLDFPDFRERGLMVDNGRKFFSLKWLENHIKELAYLKLNYFHLHISDNEGFRIESSKHPEITSEYFYTKSDLITLQQLARKYFVTIVPEIDMPNHMSSIVKHFPSTWLKDSNNNPIGSCCIDITQDLSLNLVKDILEEYLPVFEGPYWHMGADEYITDFRNFPQMLKYAQKRYGKNAYPKDAFYGFINWVDSIVNSHSKILRIWNDGMNISSGEKTSIDVNKNVIIEYWQGDVNPSDLINAGYSITNCSADRLYYLIFNPNAPLDICLFNLWNPLIYQGERKIAPNLKQILGSKLQIWCDLPDAQTEFQIGKGIRNSLRILSEKNWNLNSNESNFTEFIKKIKLIGIAPGVDFPDNLIPNNLAYGKKIYASSVEPNSTCFAELAIDGDYTTRWSSEYKDPQWIYLDLEVPTHITTVKLSWEYAYSTHYEIQSSYDAINWSTILDIENGDGEIDEFKNLDFNGRYFRIYSLKRVGNNGNSLYEIELFDSTKIKTDSGDLIHTKPDVNFNCYPNPTFSDINISYSLKEAGKFELNIVDLFGNFIYDKVENYLIPGNYNLSIPTVSISSGIYFCNYSYGLYKNSKPIFVIK